MRSFFSSFALGLVAPIVIGLLGAGQVTRAIPTTMTSSFFAQAPKPTATDSRAPPGDGNFIVTMINSHTAAVSTLHGQGAGSPTAIRRVNKHDTIRVGENITFAVPTGWTGRLALYESGHGDFLDRASLLEGSFMADGPGSAVMAMDVSYVDGFTVPIVCECNNTVVFGCNLNLLEKCPKEYLLNQKTCMNPFRDNASLGIDKFFKDCARIAYTYPTDDLATYMNIPGCSRRITCCIGTACKSHPRQILCPGADGHAEACSSGIKNETRRVVLEHDSSLLGLFNNHSSAI
ncbi:hypothetical protein AAE478_002221 [Parahypoxylon ruwenzoriense]